MVWTSTERQQTVAYCDTADGEIYLRELDHAGDDVRGFYSAFAGEVIVGIEASGYGTWFIELVEGLGHRVSVGDAAEMAVLQQLNVVYNEPPFTSNNHARADQ